MIVIGLTGSIGMGKSTAAEMLRGLGVPVHDSDAAVHALLAADGAAVTPVAARFPEAFDRKTKSINRAALGKIVFGDDAKRHDLEQILHPLVREAQAVFIRTQQRAGIKMVALDIPLLFETGAENRVDVTIVVTAPYEIQRQRVLARPGMDEEQFQKRLNSQMSDAEKRKRADFIVQTGAGMAHTRNALAGIIRELKNREHKNGGHRFPSHDR
ncbi:MAG: dephospho-CoA kinase [Alphaproteobacteria bacterium]|nr:dephospho-CoA kinase [Alphaproteobacteria bacterium]MBU0858872.1 dephospho-CoA kinase [Alphaproteobacteria bacterium]